MAVEMPRPDTSWKRSIDPLTTGGKPQSNWPPAVWRARVAGLGAASERLAGVRIECRLALDVLAEFDGEGTLFYADPPYPRKTRTSGANYSIEMSAEGWRALAAALNAARGAAAVSAYSHPFVDGLFPPPKWRKIPGPGKPGGQATEALYVNYGR
jgi:DNA adenine methylase